MKAEQSDGKGLFTDGETEAEKRKPHSGSHRVYGCPQIMLAGPRGPPEPHQVLQPIFTVSPGEYSSPWWKQGHRSKATHLFSCRT